MEIVKENTKPLICIDSKSNVVVLFPSLELKLKRIPKQQLGILNKHFSISEKEKPKIKGLEGKLYAESSFKQPEVHVAFEDCAVLSINLNSLSFTSS
jgi:hypothetical protein